MSVFRQVIFTFLVCILCMNSGLMYTWPSSTLQLFSSPNTTLNRPMTDTEQALFGSLSSVAALISTPLSGFLLDALGRKYSCILFALPQALAWTIASASNSVEGILASVFISGLGGCIFIIAPVFIGEFCQETIRGMMTTSVIIFYSIGTLVSYLLGGSLDYFTMKYVCLSLTAGGLALTALLKESPVILMRKGREKEAAEAVAYYRGEKIDSKVVMQEIDNIRRAINADPDIGDVTTQEGLLKPPANTEKLSFFQFIRRSKSTQRALVLCLFLATCSIFQGLVVIQVYAQALFNQAIPNVSTTVSSVISAILVIVAGIVAAVVIDRAGRRPLIIYSSIITGVSCAILGTQMQFEWGPSWVSALFLYTYCVAYTLGAGTVPFVIIAEVFLPEIRGVVSMMSIEWAWICNFTILFIFNPLLKVWGLGPIFYIFSSVSFLTAVYSAVFLPETKGLTVDVIQTLFVKTKRVPVV